MPFGKIISPFGFVFAALSADLFLGRCTARVNAGGLFAPGSLELAHLSGFVLGSRPDTRIAVDHRFGRIARPLRRQALFGGGVPGTFQNRWKTAEGPNRSAESVPRMCRGSDKRRFVTFPEQRILLGPDGEVRFDLSYAQV